MMKLASLSLLHIHQTYRSGIRDGRFACPQKVAPVKVHVEPPYKEEYLAATARQLLDEVSMDDLLELISKRLTITR